MLQSNNKASYLKLAPLFLILIPYLGSINKYNTIVAIIVFLLTLLWLLDFSISVRSLYSFLFTSISILFSATFSVMNDRDINLLSFTDFIFVILWFSLINILYKVPNCFNLRIKIIKSLLILSVINLIVIFVTRFSEIDLSFFYGETEVYDFSYTKIRSVGIIGQPGKLALFSSVSILCLGFAQSELDNVFVKRLALFGALFFFISSFFSFSRIGLILSLVAFLSFGFKIYIKIISTGLVLLFFFLNEDSLSLMLRASDSNSFDISSLEYRNILRSVAFSKVIETPFSFILGFGPSKEAADLIPLPMAGHSLRYPDSSLTLVLFRYGIFGLIALFFVIYCAYKSLQNKNTSVIFLNSFLLLTISIIGLSFDPLFHDPKILIVYVYTIKMLFH